MRSKNRRISLLVIRILLGLIFLLSGGGKLWDSGYVNYDLVRLLSTKFFWLIEYAAPVVISISVIELLLALMLFWGRNLRWTLTIALLMILFFSGILGYYYWQGASLASCGCFGVLGIGGGLETSLIKNFILIALLIGAFLLRTPNTPKDSSK